MLLISRGIWNYNEELDSTDPLLPIIVGNLWKLHLEEDEQEFEIDLKDSIYRWFLMFTFCSLKSILQNNVQRGTDNVWFKFSLVPTSPPRGISLFLDFSDENP